MGGSQCDFRDDNYQSAVFQPSLSPSFAHSCVALARRLQQVVLCIALHACIENGERGLGLARSVLSYQAACLGFEQ